MSRQYPHPTYRRESEIERYLYQSVRKLGGECLKWQSTHKAGLPDRLIFIDGLFYMVELKTDTGKLSEGQIEMFERFRKQGFPVLVLYGMEQVKEFINDLKRKIYDKHLPTPDFQGT